MKNALVPPVLDLSVDRYCAWKIWKDKWEDYSLLTGLDEKDNKYKCAMLRYTFSSETRNIYESFNLKAPDSENPATIITALENFAKGIVNETMERHLFNSRSQDDGEKFDDYLTEIKILSKNCNFCDNCFESLLRDRIVNGVRSDAVRQKLLSEKKLTLEKTIDICRANEKALEGMETLKRSKNDMLEVDGINKNTSMNYFRNQNRPQGQGKRDMNLKKCKFCLRTHQFGRDFCPAWKKTLVPIQQYVIPLLDLSSRIQTYFKVRGKSKVNYRARGKSSTLPSVGTETCTSTLARSS